MQLEVPSYFMGIKGNRWCFWVLTGLSSLRPCGLWPVHPLRCPLPESCGWGSSKESSAEAGTLLGRACWARGVDRTGPSCLRFPRCCQVWVLSEPSYLELISSQHTGYALSEIYEA